MKNLDWSNVTDFCKLSRCSKLSCQLRTDKVKVCPFAVTIFEGNALESYLLLIQLFALSLDYQVENKIKSLIIFHFFRMSIMSYRFFPESSSVNNYCIKTCVKIIRLNIDMHDPLLIRLLLHHSHFQITLNSDPCYLGRDVEKFLRCLLQIL